MVKTVEVKCGAVKIKFEDTKEDDTFDKGDKVKVGDKEFSFDQFVTVAKSAGATGPNYDKLQKGALKFAELRTVIPALLPQIKKVGMLLSVPQDIDAAVKAKRLTDRHDHFGRAPGITADLIPSALAILGNPVTVMVPGAYEFKSDDVGVRAMLKAQGYRFMAHPLDNSILVAVEKKDYDDIKNSFATLSGPERNRRLAALEKLIQP